ncbi:MAG: hypothetical protein MJE77_40555 [Proteobacteria bacterium]|nr:hypothetical protein [Pseudomonadota bacterium]
MAAARSQCEKVQNVPKNHIEAPLDLLIGVPSAQSDMNLIEPGNVLASYLWHKLASTQNIARGSGSSMPLGTPLSDGDIDLVAEWIDTGASP